MNDDILLDNKNISEICYETVKIESSKKPIIIVKNIIKFYMKHIMGSKNMYITIFISSKLDQLISSSYETESSNIYRKLLVEIYLMLATCNKPILDKTKSKKIKINENDAENVLLNELNTYRKSNVINSCLNILFKNKTDVLWNVIKNVSDKTDYIASLHKLFIKLEKKELLIEAYNTLSEEGYFYDNSEYKNIIFQCILKINYIYEEMNKYDKHMETYIKCLNFPLHNMKINTNQLFNYNRISYIYEDDNKLITIQQKPQQDYMSFDKI